MRNLKNIFIVSSLVILMNGCGVIIESDGSSSDHHSSPEYLRYTILDVGYYGDSDVISSGCIELFDRGAYGDVEVENLRTGENFRLSWDNSIDSISFVIREDGYLMSDTSYSHDFFSLNEVSQELSTSYGNRYVLDVKEDRYCY